jgi:hypothetical protein
LLLLARLAGLKAFPLVALANCQLLFANCLLHFFMRRVLAAPFTKLGELQPAGRRFLVLGGRVVALFALAAL